jgi:predicted transcriptional regulator
MKNVEFLSDLSDSFLRDIQSKRSIGKEPLGRLKDWISERIDLSNLQLPDSIEDLWLELQGLLQYQDLDNVDSQTAALYGALWFGASLLKQACINEENKSKFAGLLSIVNNSPNFKIVLETIEQNPGIKHERLADSCDINRKELTKFLLCFDGQCLYRTSIIGNKTYYYLTDMGKELLTKLNV